MGDVVQFRKQPYQIPCSNDNSRNLEIDSSTERVALLNMLEQNGITVVGSQSVKDFNTVLRLMRGMKDRQSGNFTSDDFLYLECMTQAMYGCTELPKDDGKFDDLLSEL